VKGHHWHYYVQSPVSLRCNVQQRPEVGFFKAVQSTCLSFIVCHSFVTSFESLAKLKYFWTTLINDICIREEIKSRLTSGNARYHSIQNLPSSSLLSKNIKIQMCIIIILPVSLCGCEAWFLKLMEEHNPPKFKRPVKKFLCANSFYSPDKYFNIKTCFWLCL